MLTAPDEGSRVFFKIGITSDIYSRPLSVQTGCPFEITEIVYAMVGHESVARAIEIQVHEELSVYRRNGEWFEFDMSNPAHKRDFNSATRNAVQQHAGENGEWCRTDMDRLRKVRGEIMAADLEGKAERNRVARLQRILRGYYKRPTLQLASTLASRRGTR